MATKLTEGVLLDMGFKIHFSLIQNSFDLVLANRVDYHKSISLSVCNDKGQGEYYLMIREGKTNKRGDDDLVVVTRNMQYKEDLEEFIRIARL